MQQWGGHEAILVRAKDVSLILKVVRRLVDNWSSDWLPSRSSTNGFPGHDSWLVVSHIPISMPLIRPEPIVGFGWPHDSFVPC